MMTHDAIHGNGQTYFRYLDLNKESLSLLNGNQVDGNSIDKQLLRVQG